MSELTEATDETLLQAFAALTHQIHAASSEWEKQLREQRDLVQDEILRRMKMSLRLL